MASAPTAHAPPQNIEAEESVLGAMLLFDVAHKEQASDFKLLSEILHGEVDRLEKLSTGEAELTGTPSGFRDIDAITGGFQPGNLIIVAARPAMGKSAIVANIAENVAV